MFYVSSSDSELINIHPSLWWFDTHPKMSYSRELDIIVGNVNTDVEFDQILKKSVLFLQFDYETLQEQKM